MAFIETEINASAVIEAMNEDGAFALEMWREIAEGLNKGMLLDNACDLLRATSVEECVFITQQIKMIPDLLAEHIQYNTPTK